MNRKQKSPAGNFQRWIQQFCVQQINILKYIQSITIFKYFLPSLPKHLTKVYNHHLTHVYYCTLTSHFCCALSRGGTLLVLRYKQIQNHLHLWFYFHSYISCFYSSLKAARWSSGQHSHFSGNVLGFARNYSSK